MSRIDGFNPLSTSRTLQGGSAQGVENSRDGRNADGAAAAGSGGYDNLSLSSRGREVALAARAVAETPDVREAKVAALKAAITNGTYTSDSRDIAARLLQSGTFGA